MVEESRPRHQTDRIPALLMPALLGGVALLVVVTLVGLGLLFPQSLHQPVDRPPPVPQPQLQLSETDDLAALRQDEDHRLSTYGWVDRAHGIAHVPIDVAIRHLAEQGIPTWPAR